MVKKGLTYIASLLRHPVWLSK